MQRRDGSLWIHSFAQGRTVYDLRCDAAAVRRLVEAVGKEDVVEAFVAAAAVADLNAIEETELRDLAVKRSGVGKRALTNAQKARERVQAQVRQAQEQRRREAERSDPRPRILNPDEDAPWLKTMGVINSVLEESKDRNPPARDVDGDCSAVRKLRVPGTYAPTADERPSKRMPAPEQWIFKKMSEAETAELIERHIDFVDPKFGDSVHLRPAFVRHYMNRHDGVLPVQVAIATAPIILPDGTLLAPVGLDRARGIVFEIQDELRAITPRPEECTPERVTAAMRLLVEQWLCDVSADFVGICTTLAAALTSIERSLLDERPAFFVTAGRRGGGKTTLVNMLVTAITGLRAACSSWSTGEDERRKALLGHFMRGVAYILWDNMTRGASVTCPHVERSCTAKFYTDRKLGVSEVIATTASSIHFFTGNNIAPRGDLASRSLFIRINVDRPDPENRDFKHPDPLRWTEDNRAKILRALYIVLLGNPQLKTSLDIAGETRFKTWWRLIGSAVEHAAKLYKPGEPVTSACCQSARA